MCIKAKEKRKNKYEGGGKKYPDQRKAKYKGLGQHEVLLEEEEEKNQGRGIRE